MQGGVIEGAGQGFAAVNNTGAFYMYGGDILGCAGAAVVNAGICEINSSGTDRASIMDNAGVGLANTQGGNATLYNCYIARNGLGVDNAGYAYVDNGTNIWNNHGGEVGGIRNTGTLEFQGGSVVGNTGSVAGGVLSEDSLTLSGVEIRGNTGGLGGGVVAGGEVLLQGPTIRGNTATGEDGVGGVYLREGTSVAVQFDLQITDNYKNGAISNLFLSAGVTLEPDAHNSGALYIGICSGAPEAGTVLTSGLKDSGYVLCAFSENAGYTIELNDAGEAALCPIADEGYTVVYMLDEDTEYARFTVKDGDLPPWVTPEKEGYLLDGWVTADGAAPTFSDGVHENVTLYPVWYTGYMSPWQVVQAMLREGGYVRLPMDITADPGASDTALTVPAGVTATLDLNGFMLDGSTLNATVISVQSGGALTLTDSRRSADSGSGSGGGGGQVCRSADSLPGTVVGGRVGSVVEVGGRFSLVCGDISGSSGIAGVHVSAGGVFEMSGGSVLGNAGARNGGVYNEGTFTMTGGRIDSNRGLVGAGGVTNRGAFTLSGGSVVGNSGKASSAVANYGTFTMTGGRVIQNGLDARDAGAVHNADQAVFTLSGGSVEQNGGAGFGGVYNLGQFSMSGGRIWRNVSQNGVGGVWQAGGSFALSGGSIMNNLSRQFVSGVYLEGGALTLSGSPKVYGNENNGMSIDLFLSTGRTVAIGGALGDDLWVGLAPEEMDATVTVTEGLGNHGGIGGFFSDAENVLAVALVEGEVALVDPQALPDSQEHTVYYRVYGSQYATRRVADGEYAPFIDISDIPELQLNYWYDENDDSTWSDGYDFENTPVTGDLWLDADVTTMYRVDLLPNGGAGTAQTRYIADNGSLTLPECPFQPPVGKRFFGWNTTTGIYLPGENIRHVSGDLTFEAVWEGVEYAVQVDDGIAHGALEVQAQTWTAGDSISIGVLPDQGYAMDSLTYTIGGVAQTTSFGLYGFYGDTYPLNIVTEPGDVTITATFRMISTMYTVEFRLEEDGTVLERQEVEANMTAAAPEIVPQARGKAFAGWRIPGKAEAFDFSTPILGDLTLVPLWQDLPEYFVDLNAAEHGTVAITAESTVNAEAVTTQVEAGVTPVYAGEAVRVTVTPESGYALGELSATDELGASIEVTDGGFTMPEGNVGVTVGIVAVGEHTVTVVKETVGGGNGVVQAKERADAEESVPFLAEPEEGCYIKALTLEYTLDGEFVTQDLSGQDAFTMPDADVTLRAVFSDHVVSVAQDIANGAVVPSAEHARAGASVRLTITPDEGYRLDTLSVADAGGASVPVEDDAFTMPAADVAVEATFRLEGLWFVRFETGAEDVSVPTQEVMTGDTAAAPEIERTGYLLLGWRAEGAEADFDFENTPVTGDLLLTARWEKLCKVTIYNNKATPSSAVQYVRTGERAVEPVLDPVEGYTMQAWTVGSYSFDLFDFSQPVTKDTNVVAEWARNVYSWADLVTFAANDTDRYLILMNDITRGEDQGKVSIDNRNKPSVDLNLNGHTVDVNRLDREAFYLENNLPMAHLILKDYSHDGDGRITGAIRNVVHVSYGANFEMRGGAISGNDIHPMHELDCGAVYVAGGGSCSIYGGVIENNTAHGEGGAITSDGTCYIRGGVIRNNYATGNGGGIYIADGILQMEGGQILGNVTDGIGGGIYCSYGMRRARIYDGLISGNSA